MTTKLCYVMFFAPGEWNSSVNRGGGVLIDYDEVIEAMLNPHPFGLTRRPGHSELTNRCLKCEVCACYGTPRRAAMPYRALLGRCL